MFFTSNFLKEKMLGHKKGITYDALPTIIAGFIFIIVMISVGAIIVNTVSKEPTFFTDVAVSKEAFTPVAATAVQLAHDDIVVGSETLQNVTTCKITGNYTMNYWDGKITCLAGSSCCGGNSTKQLNLSYTWQYYDAGYNATVSGQEALLNLSGQLGLLALIIVLATVIAAITMYLWKGF